MNKPIELLVTVYTPESQVRHPVHLLRTMWADLRASNELGWRLFRRDLSAQYRQSMLGVFWAFIPPIITSVIFIVLQSQGVVNFGDTDIPYPAYVLVGTMLWQLFTESLNAPLKSLTAAKPMLTKINFPRESLILSAIYMVLFSLLIKLLIIIAVVLIYQLKPGWGILLAPVPIMMLLLLGIAGGVFLTPIGMLYTDVASALPVLTQLLFFVTPVVYPPPQSFPFSLIVFLNPISPLIIAARDLLTTGTMSNTVHFVIVSGLILLAIPFVWVLFRISLPIIIERVGA